MPVDRIEREHICPAADRDGTAISVAVDGDQHLRLFALSERLNDIGGNGKPGGRLAAELIWVSNDFELIGNSRKASVRL